ncbi:MAG: ClpXP protease specificity-enhancing factor [Thioalkalispiraceae bacterium]|jgi:stringent starvation protein B
MTSSQPYLLRAIYEWIVDNDMTPYILVNANMENTHVPRQYVENGKIVLNLAPQAVSDLQLANEFVMFNARFSGKSMEVNFPVAAVLAIYAKENGQGMVFGEGDDQPPPTEPSPDDSDQDKKPHLKLVK